jgi:luciferase family oxidoreductase group 1
MIKLSVLDQSVTVTGRSENAAIRETLSLARQCEALGYHRYWLSEHHDLPTVAGTAPEVLMAAVAATTERIRVGSAGVMLPHYAAFKVAEQFRVLEAIAPGRIDLGVGRAPGSDLKTARALNPAASADPHAFPAQVRDLMAWVGGSSPPQGHPHHGIMARPLGPSVPEVWMLGSSDFGAQLAAHYGLPYSFAHFITEGYGLAQAMEIYRATYRPSERHPKPYASICIWALAADTEAEAEQAFASRALWRLEFERGVRRPLLPPQEAQALLALEPPEKVARLRQRALVGTSTQVGARLRDLAEQLQLQELVVLTWAYDPEVRRRSYALLAEEFGLQG